MLFFPVLILSKDFKESSFPGGYVGLSIQYGSERTLGFQISTGIAVPAVGEPAVGPYLFPGIAVGWRKSFATTTAYSFIDLQLTLIQGFWVGGGVGYAFSDSGNFFRHKQYAGFLIGGITSEKPFQVQAVSVDKFLGLHLGLTYPFMGNHLYP